MLGKSLIISLPYWPLEGDVHVSFCYEASVSVPAISSSVSVHRSTGLSSSILLEIKQSAMEMYFCHGIKI